MNASVNLLLLLSLRNDPATELDADGVPTLLREPDDRGAWRRLAELLDDAPAVASPDATSPLNESMVAAYLEGALSTPEATEVEAACWRHAEAMQELVSIHRDLNQPTPPAPSLSLPLQARLLSLVPETPSSPAPLARVNGSDSAHVSAESIEKEATTKKTSDAAAKMKAHPGEVATPGLHQAAATPPPAPPVPPPAPSKPQATTVQVDQVGQSDSSYKSSTAERLRKQGRNNAWALWAGLAVVAAITLLFIWSQRKNADEAPGGREIAAPPDYNTILPDGPEDPTRDETPDSDNSATPIDVKPAPTAVNNGGAPGSGTPDDPMAPKNDPPAVGPAPNTGPKPPLRQKPPSYPAIAMQWSEVEGLVVARADETLPWSGAEAESLESKASHYATLPGSWAKADTTRYGEIVFDANTHISLLPNSAGSAPEFAVRHGRVAFRDTPADAAFEFRTGVQHFSVQAPKSSSFAVIYGPGGPQVWVRRGKLQMGQTSIRKGQYVRWENGDFTGAEKLKEGTAWFDEAPLERVRLDKLSQKTLMHSDNVFADLARISQDGSPDLQAAAASWNVMLNPIGHLHRGLSAHNPQVRMRTLHWLHSQDPRDRITGLVWRKLGQDTGDYATVTQIRQWNKRFWLKQPIDPSLASQMLRGLSNNDAAIRQLAVFYLEANFGRRFGYDPVARLATQRQPITLWSQFIRAHFSNPRNQR